MQKGVSAGRQLLMQPLQWAGGWRIPAASRCTNGEFTARPGIPTGL